MEEKVAIVTGGGSGIGKETALKLAKVGHKVIIADFSDERGRETLKVVNEIREGGMFIQVDVSNATDIQNMIHEVQIKYGHIDILINNAGILSTPALLTELSEESFDRLIAVNLKSVFLGMKYVLPVMVEQKSGVIVNTASSAGLISTPFLSGYSASKHGVVGLTKTAAEEFGPNGIRINAVCPGGVLTNMTKDMEMSDPVQNGPLRRPANPSEIANVIVFLTSDDASYVNGSIIPVDGSLTS